MNAVELRGELTRLLDDPVDVRVLLEEATEGSLVRLLLAADEELSEERVTEVLAAAERRRRGEPLQHVVGHWPFRSLELTVDRRALIPRPETELVVDRALELLDRRGAMSWPVRCLDLGTGTGAIAISLAVERPNCRVVAVEVSPPALELAAVNLARQPADVQERVRLVEGSWYGPLSVSDEASFDLIVSNPPYLSQEEWGEVDALVRDYDPREALVAGPEGSEAVEAVLLDARRHLREGAVVVIEIGWKQAITASEIAWSAGARVVEIRADLAGRDRILVAGF